VNVKELVLPLKKVTWVIYYEEKNGYNVVVSLCRKIKTKKGEMEDIISNAPGNWRKMLGTLNYLMRKFPQHREFIKNLVLID